MASGVGGGGDSSFQPLTPGAYESLTPSEKSSYNADLYQYNANQVENAKGVSYQKGQIHDLKNYLIDAAEKEGKGAAIGIKMYNNFIKSFAQECIREMQHAAAQAKQIEQAYKQEG